MSDSNKWTNLQFVTAYLSFDYWYRLHYDGYDDPSRSNQPTACYQLILFAKLNYSNQSFHPLIHYKHDNGCIPPLGTSTTDYTNISSIMLTPTLVKQVISHFNGKAEGPPVCFCSNQHNEQWTMPLAMSVLYNKCMENIFHRIGFLHTLYLKRVSQPIHITIYCICTMRNIMETIIKDQLIITCNYKS